MRCEDPCTNHAAHVASPPCDIHGPWRRLASTGSWHGWWASLSPHSCLGWSWDILGRWYFDCWKHTLMDNMNKFDVVFSNPQCHELASEHNYITSLGTHWWQFISMFNCARKECYSCLPKLYMSEMLETLLSKARLVKSSKLNRTYPSFGETFKNAKTNFLAICMRGPFQPQ